MAVFFFTQLPKINLKIIVILSDGVEISTFFEYRELSTDIEDRNSVNSEYRASFELRARSKIEIQSQPELNFELELNFEPARISKFKIFKSRISS
jgi:hypothetical protein